MIDLHIHSNCSDGLYSVEEILKKAEKKKCSHISITDHNTCNAYDEIGKYTIFSGIIVSGCEFNTYCMGIPIELLGYDFDISALKMELRALYKYSAKDIMSKQYTLFFDNCKKNNIAYKKTKPFDNSCITSDYYHECISNITENRKYFDNSIDFHSPKNFYRGYISNPESIFYCDMSNFYPSLNQVITAIHKCNGLVFIPHIFEYKDKALAILDELSKKYEIDGLECYYSKFSIDQQLFLKSYAIQNNLLISGGSDFHHGKTIDIGVGKGDLNISKYMIGKWIDRATDYNHYRRNV